MVDADPARVGTEVGGNIVQPESDLENVLRAHEVDIVILAVPAAAVQGILDRVVAAGIRGVLNFAPAPVSVPEGVWVKDVNMVVELEALSFALSQEDADR